MRICLQKYSSNCGIIIIIVIWYFCISLLVPLLIIRMVFDKIPLCVLNPADTVSVLQSNSFVLFVWICSLSLEARQLDLMACRDCVRHK